MINARNQIVFGTDKGFIEISPKEVQKSTYVPPIVFTGLKVQGQSSVIAIDDLEELRLNLPSGMLLSSLQHLIMSILKKSATHID